MRFWHRRKPSAEAYAVWANDLWREQAEARLRILADERRRYGAAAVAVRRMRVEREAEAVVEAAGF